MRLTVLIGILSFISLLMTDGIYGRERKQFYRPLPETIPVSYNLTTVIVFPAAIKEADMGSRDILAKTAKKALNVLKVKAARKHFEPTNLTVLTADGRLYSFKLCYDSLPLKTTFDLTDSLTTASASSCVQYIEEGLNEAEISQYARTVAGLKPITGHPRMSNALMQLRLSGIYIAGDHLFFQFGLSNKSQIPFDIDFTRFYLTDKRKGKRTAQMQKEIEPSHIFFSAGNTVRADKGTVFVIAFKKFTIADSKYFVVEVNENNGDRHLSCKLKGKNIMKAKPFIPPAR